MSQRTAKFVSAIFASLLVGTPLVTVSHSAPAEADKCLSGPKGAPPAGGHWYYRIDRATKRNCWYIGDEKEKLARAAPENAPPAASSASPPTSPRPPSSIANARAELPLPQTRVEPETSVFTAPRTPAAVTSAISPENNQRANIGDAGAQKSVVASRWPELAGVSTPTSPAPSTDNSAVGAPANSRTASTLSQAAPASSRPAPTAAVAALPPVTADASSTEKPSSSVQMLLIAILGALALAGLLVSAIFRLSGRRRTGHHGIRIERRVNWDSARTDRPSLSDQARASRPMQEIELPRELRAAGDPNERIAQMLTRLARSAAT